MRLIHTARIELVEYTSPSTFPRYAILSHRWRNEEVLLHNIQEPDVVKTMEGYSKIISCCTQARLDGYDWVWIDTCCIDKTSSSELSEAINSMYMWYSKSEVCYAFLDDVRSDEDPKSEGSSFRRSTWFKRGWTLQELIAPSSVVFFAGDWVDIGTRTSLAYTIEDITRIEHSVLWSLPKTVSIARRMSWASNRETTREEDQATR
ncbi:hypothetical protein A0H81_10585 [Grifola frondosa]|uniref:Heterokaryon incompatibility domain-containing protein n=1 Tax=Grifola frondosa TaxID=5627 RepID=A0A1C7M4A2_GRIFR|nr:hypothetical protein A0H81_10585 [Grifola frondosa]